MDNKDNTNQNTDQVQNNVNSTVTNNDTNANTVVNSNATVQTTQAQNAVNPNNTVVQNTTINDASQTQAPLTPNVAPVESNSNNNEQGNTNIPKSQAEAVSNSNEVNTDGELISASEAGVGTSTSMKTKEELTKKDKLLDGLPGIGVPVKDENPTNNSVDNTPSQPEEVNKEKVTFKKKVQYFFTIVFFILVAVFIYFLPEITDFLSKEQEKKEVIKDGFLTCKLETNKADITTSISSRFGFSNEKLETYKREKTISASSSKDSQLNDADKECEALYEQTKSLSGVDVKCSLKNKVQTTTQSIDYGTININKVTSAFSEAGGTYPDYELDDDINEIESDMASAGFNCNRSKT